MVYMAASTFEKRIMKVNGEDKETVIERNGNDVKIHLPNFKQEAKIKEKVN